MESAAAPVSLKGTRESLLLIATGLFLSLGWNPITGVLGAAGIALGMHDLRKCEAARTLGRLRVVTAVAAWCACALWLTLLAWQALFVLEPVALFVTVFCTALALSQLARADAAAGLARAFSLLRWTPLFLISPLLIAELGNAAALAYFVACLALAVLTLRLRSRALPYGRRLSRRAA